jgi:hypothetical protein
MSTYKQCETNQYRANDGNKYWVHHVYDSATRRRLTTYTEPANYITEHLSKNPIAAPGFEGTGGAPVQTYRQEPEQLFRPQPQMQSHVFMTPMGPLPMMPGSYWEGGNPNFQMTSQGPLMTFPFGAGQVDINGGLPYPPAPFQTWGQPTNAVICLPNGQCMRS